MSDNHKTVLVTGANRGLGAAIAAVFHKAGWHVVGTSRNVDALPSDIVDTPLALDLSDLASLRSLAKAVNESGVKISLLINNAGFNPKDKRGDPNYFQSTFKIDQFSATNVAESMWINALTPIELVSKLIPSLADDAVVLNISSWLGSIGQKDMGGHYGYAGSKALLNMMTRALALEWQGSSRAAVALNPGWMRTDMGGDNAKRTPEDTAKDILALYRSGELGGAKGKFINADGSEHAW
ncbi:MAG: SDR family NAD(P)-dependent oxidoreductase [Pseudomonadota bacterium]